MIDTHPHLFNAGLGGKGGIPKLLSMDATVEGAEAAMRRGGVDKAFPITYNANRFVENQLPRAEAKTSDSKKSTDDG